MGRLGYVRLALLNAHETWVNVCQTTFKGKEKTIQTPKDAYLALLTIGLKDPTQQGPRFFTVHAGDTNCFFEEA